MTKLRKLLLFIVLLMAVSCGGPPDSQSAVPAGDPSFPSFAGVWVIDKTGIVSKDIITQSHEVLEALRKDGIAETVILVINGVHHPEQYATRYGRFLKLGSTETNNGLVWLVRPDAGKDEHIVYSVARGLPAFTSGKVTEASLDASELANQGDYADAVGALAQGTNRVLRELQESRPETVTEEGEPEVQVSPEESRVLVITVLVIIGIWLIIFVVLLLIDPGLAFQWLFLGFRIILLSATGGKAGKTGGSGKFGGRSGTR